MLWGASSLKQSWSTEGERTENIRLRLRTLGKERDWEGETEIERACNLPISQENCPEIGFHELPQVLYYKSSVINLQQNDSWLRHKLGVGWQARDLQRICGIACGVPAGQRKMPCQGEASKWGEEKNQLVHPLSVLNYLPKLKPWAPWGQSFRMLGWKVKVSEVANYSLSSKVYKERDILQSKFPYWK